MLKILFSQMNQRKAANEDETQCLSKVGNGDERGDGFETRLKNIDECKHGKFPLATCQICK